MDKQMTVMLSKSTGLSSALLNRLKIVKISNCIARIYNDVSYVDYDYAKCKIIDYVGDIEKLSALFMILGDISHMHIYNMELFKVINHNRILNNEEDTDISCTVEIRKFRTVLNIYAGEIRIDSKIFRNSSVSLTEDGVLHIRADKLELLFKFTKFITPGELEELRSDLKYEDS